MSTDLGPTLGALAAVLALLALLAPTVLLAEAAVAGLGTYYGAGVLGGAFVAVVATLGLVTAIALAAAGRERSDPAWAGGVALGLASVLLLLALQWAVAVPESVVAGIGTATWLEWHRWIVVVLLLPVPIAALRTARS